jgi:hypothetical protein
VRRHRQSKGRPFSLRCRPRQPPIVCPHQQQPVPPCQLRRCPSQVRARSKLVSRTACCTKQSWHDSGGLVVGAAQTNTCER